MEEKLYFEKLNEYYVKDGEARDSILTLETVVGDSESGLVKDVNDLKESVQTNTSDISDLKIASLSNTNSINNNTSSIADITNKSLEYGTVNYAHRGLSSEAPENTIPAIYKAGLHGCYGVEIDIQTTADNKIILMHDTTVDRTTTGTGTVNELLSSYIDTLTIDFGNYVEQFPNLKVPYLSEVLPVLNNFGLIPMLELKGTWSTQNLELLINLLTLHNYLDRCTIISFSLPQLAAVRSINPNVRLGLLVAESLTSSIVEDVIELGKCDISLYYVNNSTLSEEIRLEMLNNNINFGFWTLLSIYATKTIKANNSGLSFIVSDYGFGGKIKQKFKNLIAILDSDGLSVWANKVPETNTGYTYDNFSISLVDADSKDYRLTYTTPFDVDLDYSTIVTAHLEGAYELQYSIWARSQSNTGFNFYIVDSEGNKLTIDELYTAIGTTFININICGS